MKTIYICVDGSFTGKTLLASLLNREVYVFDDYYPDFFENTKLVEKINDVKDRDAIFFIVCSEYSSDLILTLHIYLKGKCKVIVCENRVVITKEDVE